MKKPPLLPSEALRRVLRVARFNGWVVLAISGAFALGSASIHDTAGTAVGLLIAGAGAMELHGASLVNHGEAQGVNWMIGSQFYLMAVMFGYIWLRLQHIDVGTLEPFLTPDQHQAIAQAGLTTEEFLRAVYVSTWSLVGALTLIYQSAMAIYYHRRRGPITVALKEADDGE